MADNDDIPFNRDFPLKPGVADEVRAGVRRVLCNNPSPFTFTGTVSYIVGKGNVAIIDPGPDDEAHAKALLDAVRGETVTHILVTHTHRDHSPNTARIKAATGAPVYAEGPHRASRPRFESEKHNPESGADRDFQAGCRCEGRRHHRGRRLGAGGGGDAWSHRQPSGLCLAGAEDQFRRRSRDGLVDLDRGAAGRVDDRLHGVARTPREPRRRICISRATARKFRKARVTCASWRGIARPAKPRSCIGSPRARPIFRPWSARSISASIRGSTGAAGYSVLAHLEDLVGARRRDDGRRSGDRRDVSVASGE